MNEEEKFELFPVEYSQFYQDPNMTAEERLKLMIKELRQGLINKKELIKSLAITVTKEGQICLWFKHKQNDFRIEMGKEEADKMITALKEAITKVLESTIN